MGNPEFYALQIFNTYLIHTQNTILKEVNSLFEFDYYTYKHK